MVDRGKLNSDLQVVEPDILKFRSSNDWRRTTKAMFLVLSALMLVTEIIMVFQVENYPEMLFGGEDRVELWAFALSPLVFLLLWWLAPIREVYFDRRIQSVRYKTKKVQYGFPWDQVVPTHSWALVKPTKLEWLILRVKPPYPEDLARIAEMKSRTKKRNDWSFNLGILYVENPEHAEAMFAFLDTWMRSREPAEQLYASMVLSRFEY